ncbi:MAG: hypothetical protein AB1489_30930 [Acidobacteriota bacterium]
MKRKPITKNKTPLLPNAQVNTKARFRLKYQEETGDVEVKVIESLPLHYYFFHLAIEHRISVSQKGYVDVYRAELAKQLGLKSSRMIDYYNEMSRQHRLMKIVRTGRANRYEILAYPALMGIAIEQSEESVNIGEEASAPKARNNNRDGRVKSKARKKSARGRS